MGFAFNWKQQPMYYAPGEDAGRVGDPQSVWATKYSQDMSGYRPASAGMAPNAIGVQPHNGAIPVNYDGYGDTLQQASNVAMSNIQSGLQAELEANNAKIAELKRELAQIQGGSRLAEDERDRMLAVNRARIGDIADSMIHQNRPEQRRLTALREQESKQYKISELQNKRDSLVYLQNLAETTADKQKIQFQIDSIDNQIKQAGGVPVSTSFKSAAPVAGSGKTVAQVKEAYRDAWEVGPDGKTYLREDIDPVDLMVEARMVDPTGENTELQEMVRKVKQGKKFKEAMGDYTEDNYNTLVARVWDDTKKQFRSPELRAEYNEFYANMPYKSEAVVKQHEAIKDGKTGDEKKKAWNKTQSDYQKAVDDFANAAQFVGKTATLTVNGKNVVFSVSFDDSKDQYVFKANGHTIYKAN